MNKKLLALALAGTFAFAGCGNNAEEKPAETTTEPAVEEPAKDEADKAADDAAKEADDAAEKADDAAEKADDTAKDATDAEDAADDANGNN